jgi:hypothetical protein
MAGVIESPRQETRLQWRSRVLTPARRFFKALRESRLVFFIDRHHPNNLERVY